MKVIIAGSRSIKDYALVQQACADFEAKHGKITEVVCGGAQGVDALGKRWAKDHGLYVRMFPAKWDDKTSPTYDKFKLYDPAAGRKRNWEMARYADALILIWDGTGSNERDLLRAADKIMLKIHEVNMNPKRKAAKKEESLWQESASIFG